MNGILYSLLSLPELREEARTMVGFTPSHLTPSIPLACMRPQGMGDMLTSAMQASPPELQSQLNYILVQLHSGEPNKQGSTL